MFSAFIVGIGLSMDAFSLSLVYGTNNINNRDRYLLSLIVGIFHFFMPLLGSFLGNVILFNYYVNVNIVVSIIFGLIGIDMILSGLRNKEVNIISSLFGFIIFGLSVSIDSFTTGIGFSLINNNNILFSFIFMLCSGVFTYIGLIMGNFINKRFGNIANIFGGIVFIILVLYYLF